MSARCLRCGAGNEWIEGQASMQAADEKVDVERYRFLRSGGTGPGKGVIDWEPLGELFDEQFDAAIDATRRGKP